MTDQEAQLRREVQRGANAQALIDNPLMIEALDAYENEIVNQWKTSPLRDADGREKLRLMLDAATKFRAYLLTTADTGKLASATIQEKRDPLTRLRRAFG